MRLRVIVDRLKLTKENLEYGNGEEFEVSEERGIEILKTTFNGKPVVEFVSSNENPETDEKLITEKAELENRVKELEEDNKTLIAEKAELENKIKELEKPTNSKCSKKEGEDK